jgi:hypothetical protein
VTDSPIAAKGQNPHERQPDLVNAIDYQFHSLAGCTDLGKAVMRAMGALATDAVPQLLYGR